MIQIRIPAQQGQGLSPSYLLTLSDADSFLISTSGWVTVMTRGKAHAAVSPFGVVVSKDE